MADNTSVLGLSYVKVPSGTTAERPASPTQGMLRYNTSTGALETYTSTNTWGGLEPPPLLFSYSGKINTDTNSTITITGQNFLSGAVVTIYGDATGGVDRNLVTTYVSGSSLTAATNAGAVNYVSGASFSIKVTNPSGNTGSLTNAGIIDRDPVWTTSSGNISTYAESESVTSPITSTAVVSPTLVATDPDSDTVSYNLTSGSLPSGLSLNSSSGAITGTTPTVASTTTYPFTVEAVAAGFSTPRTFNIIVGKRTVYPGTGSAGDVTISTTTSVNNYCYITDASRTTSQNSCTVDTTSGFTVGTRVLIHQTQCASDTSLIGRMQYNVVTNVSGNVLTFANNFTWGIISNTANAASCNMCQIVSIPQYNNLTITGSGILVPGLGWNGTKGGILIFETRGTTTVNAGGIIRADGTGFRGGNGGTGVNQGTTNTGGGFYGESATGGGKNYGSKGGDGGVGSGAGGTGHVNLHSVVGSQGVQTGSAFAAGGTGYGGGGGSGHPSPSGSGAGGGGGGSLTYNWGQYRASLGGGAGGGGAGAPGNNTGGNGAGGGGAGGGIIIIRSGVLTNNGTIRSRPGYGAGGPGGYANVGNHGNYTGGVGGDSSNSGNGQIGSGSQAINQTAGGAGTGVGGARSQGAGPLPDYGGDGGYTGISGGGNGGKGNNGSADGVGGGGAGGSGGGGGGGNSDVGAGGGGGQGGAGGAIYIETTTLTAGTIAAPRGLGGGGGGGSNGWSGSTAGYGGDAQENPSAGTGYRNGASGTAVSYGGGGGGAAGYVGNLGQVVIYTQSGSYTGTITTTDAARSETGIGVTTSTLPVGASPFGNNGYGAA